MKAPNWCLFFFQTRSDEGSKKYRWKFWRCIRQSEVHSSSQVIRAARYIACRLKYMYFSTWEPVEMPLNDDDWRCRHNSPKHHRCLVSAEPSRRRSVGYAGKQPGKAGKQAISSVYLEHAEGWKTFPVLFLLLLLLLLLTAKGSMLTTDLITVNNATRALSVRSNALPSFL